MAIKYLLDTNVLSEPLKQNPQMTVLERIRTHSAEIATASVVWHELWYGMHRMAPSRKKDAIQEYLLRLETSSMRVLPYDEVAAAKRKRLSNPPLRVVADQGNAVFFQFQGKSSWSRLLGQVGNFSSTSQRYAKGSTPLSLQVSMML